MLFHGALAGDGRLGATWSAVRKLVGRKKPPFWSPVRTLGDDAKPLASLPAKADQHQRELVKELGKNCAEFSEAEHLVRVQADKQAQSVSGRSSTSCVWARRHSFGVDCIRRPQISLRAGRYVCHVSKEGAPIFVEGRRHGGRSS